MSHYRNLSGGARDVNEPEIMKHFLVHGWHPEQVSGNRLWDLNAYPPKQPSQRVHGVATCLFHVDVKTAKGKVTPAQAEKWTTLRAKGIPVYVVRTAEDVDALVRGELVAWEPEDDEVAIRRKRSARARNQYSPPLATTTADAGKGQKRGKRSCAAICDGGCGKRLWTKAKGIVKASVLCDDCRAAHPNTSPVTIGRRPTSVAEDNAAFDVEVKRRLGLKVAKEAEETFAPGSVDACDYCVLPAGCPCPGPHFWEYGETP